MSGVAVVRWLLANNSAVLAALGAGPPAAADRIKAGDLPLNTVMPAISVTQVDSIPLNFIRINETQKMYTERVQVSVLFKGPQGSPAGLGYPGVVAMMKLIPPACPSQRGTVNNIVVDSIVPAGEGPDLSDDATALYSRSTDFIVKWIGA